MESTSVFHYYIQKFASLSEGECAEIADFTLLWGLFEARLLSSSGCVSKICAVVDEWEKSQSLSADEFNEELEYFRNRYFSDGAATNYFNDLNFRNNDNEALVRRVIGGQSDTPSDRVSALLIIVFRLRNNLFHGLKWEYRLADQLDNFKAANSILVKVLKPYLQLETD